MAIFHQLLVVLAALAGLGFGYSLTYITPSEVIAGRRYFQWLEKTFFLAAFVPVLYYVLSADYWFWGGGVLILAGALFFFPLWVRVSLFTVFFSLVLFFFTPGAIPVHIVQGTLVFLYGLPAGTLLRDANGLEPGKEPG